MNKIKNLKSPKGKKITTENRRMFKFSEPASYDPETGKVTSGKVIKTPLLALSDELSTALKAFQEAAEENPDDEQIQYLFREFKRNARSFTTHVKKHYRDVGEYL
jgi:hypothetical protein